MHKPTEHCIKWRDELLSNVNPDDKITLSETLDEIDNSTGYKAANIWLGGVIERYELFAKISFLRPTVAKKANHLAKNISNAASLTWLKSVVKRLHFCDSLITSLDGEELARWAEQKSTRFEVDLTEISIKQGADKGHAFIKATITEMKLTFNGWDDTDRVVGLAARMITPAWWSRQAKRQWAVVEDVLRECGEVHRHASPYISRWSLNKHRNQVRSNRNFLEGWEAVNQFDKSYTLAELSDKSISNPLYRRHELMTRIRGCEELAIDMGLTGLFLTATCPSKYHAVKGSGHHNDKFFKQGCPNARAAQKYLCTVFARFRSYCKRHKIHYFGIRTVEPHHDGTPHWHLMLFINQDKRDELVNAFRKYFLEEDGDENGAQENRIEVVDMNPAEGTASGYVAKYISKGIDGEHIDVDHETGQSGKSAAEGIIGWARRNCIKQFQFLGCVSVTVWRELRRLKVEDAPKSCLEIFHSAKRADWMKFTQLMGGAFAGKKQALKTYYVEGEENQYGETPKIIKGVKAIIDVIETRLYEWTVQRKGSGSVSGAVSVSGSCSKKDGEADPSWTRVNKCTPANLLQNLYELPATSYQDDRGDQYVF